MNDKTKNDVFFSEQYEEHITLRMVGIVRSEIKELSLKAGDDGLTRQVQMQQEKEYHKRLMTNISELVVDEDLSGMLDGIDGYLNIPLLFTYPAFQSFDSIFQGCVFGQDNSEPHKGSHNLDVYFHGPF